jgi:hypothetical protein
LSGGREEKGVDGSGWEVIAWILDGMSVLLEESALIIPNIKSRHHDGDGHAKSFIYVFGLGTESRLSATPKPIDWEREVRNVSKEQSLPPRPCWKTGPPTDDETLLRNGLD